jgi:hypothetical protein
MTKLWHHARAWVAYGDITRPNDLARAWMAKCLAIERIGGQKRRAVGLVMCDQRPNHYGVKHPALSNLLAPMHQSAGLLRLLLGK